MDQVMLKTLLTPFENFIIRKLVSFLGLYIQNINEDIITLKLTAGILELENLKLKENIFCFSELPFKLISGTIGKLSLRVPFLHSGTNSFHIYLESFNILLRTVEVFKNDKGGNYLGKLKLAEGCDEFYYKLQKSLDNSFPDSSFPSIIRLWLYKFFLLASERFHLEVKKVHVRFEDELSNLASPLSGGITLELLEFVSCTPDWSPCPPADVSGGPTIFKLLKIDRLSLYLNPGETRLLHKLKDEHELLYWMKVLISSSERAPLELCYLLQPVFVRGKVSLKVSGEGLLSDFPDLHITISVEDLSFIVDNEQLRSINTLYSYFNLVTIRSLQSRARPNEKVKENPLAWWLYAIECVNINNIKRRTAFSWTRLKLQRDLRKAYLATYKQIVMAPKPSTELLHSLEQLESFLSHDDIIIFRKIGESRFGHLKDINPPPLLTSIRTLLSTYIDKIMPTKPGYSAGYHDSSYPLSYLFQGVWNSRPIQFSTSLVVKVPRITLSLCEQKAPLVSCPHARADNIGSVFSVLALKVLMIEISDVGLLSSCANIKIKSVRLSVRPFKGLDLEPMIFFRTKSVNKDVAQADMQSEILLNVSLIYRAAEAVSRSLIIELNSLTFCYRKECVSRLISFSKQALANRHCVENSAPVFMSSKDRLSVFGTKVGHLFRRGNMTVHITLKPLVLLLASSVSRLALSSGSVDFHFFPGKTSVPPLQCSALVKVLRETSSKINFLNRPTQGESEGHMHLVLDGVSCVYVERPYSWENELFGTALIKSSRVLSSTSLWLELAYSSDEPDKDDPLFSIHGGVSFITFFLSFPVMKLLTEHFADSANQTSLNKESSPIMQKQHIPSALLTPSHFLLYSHFVMEGLRFKLVRVRPEVGEFTTLFLSRVNPVSVTFTKRHSSKQLTISVLGIFMNIYAGTKQYTFFKIKGYQLGECGLVVTWHFVDNESPDYADVDQKLSVAVGRLALNIDSELFALFPKILHYFKENLTRLYSRFALSSGVTHASTKAKSKLASSKLFEPGFGPPQLTKAGIKVQTGDTCVYKSRICCVQLIAALYGERIFLFDLSGISSVFTKQYTSFIEGSLQITSLSAENFLPSRLVRFIAWTELEEVASGSLSLSSGESDKRRLDLRVHLSQFFILLEPDFLQKFMDWCSLCFSAYKLVASHLYSASERNAKRMVTSSFLALTCVVHVSGELPIVLLFCGGGKDARRYFLFDVGPFKCDARRSRDAATMTSCPHLLEGNIDIAATENLHLTFAGFCGMFCTVKFREDYIAQRYDPGRERVISVFDKSITIPEAECTFECVSCKYSRYHRGEGAASYYINVTLYKLAVQLSDKDAALACDLFRRFRCLRFGGMEGEHRDTSAIKANYGRTRSLSSFEKRTDWTFSSLTQRCARTVSYSLEQRRKAVVSFSLTIYVDSAEFSAYLLNESCPIASFKAQGTAYEWRAFAAPSVAQHFCIPVVVLYDTSNQHGKGLPSLVITHEELRGERGECKAFLDHLQCYASDRFLTHYAKFSARPFAIFYQLTESDALLSSVALHIQKPRIYLKTKFINALRKFSAGYMEIYENSKMLQRPFHGNKKEEDGCPSLFSTVMTVNVDDIICWIFESANDENGHVIEVVCSFSGEYIRRPQGGEIVKVDHNVLLKSFSLTNRSATEFDVVKPVCVRFYYRSFENSASGRLSVSPVELSLTFHDVKALLAISRNLLRPRDSHEALGEMDVRYAERNVDKERWFFASDCPNEGGDLNKRNKSYVKTLAWQEFTKNTYRHEVFDVDILNFNAMLIDDSGEHFLPVIALNVGTELSVRNWSSALDARAHVKLVASSYNPDLCTWECVVEPCVTIPPGRRRYASCIVNRPQDTSRDPPERSLINDKEGRADSLSKLSSELTNQSTLKKVKSASCDVELAESDTFWALKLEFTRINEGSHTLFYVDLSSDKVLQFLLTSSFLATLKRFHSKILSSMHVLDSRNKAVRQSPIRVYNALGVNIILHIKQKNGSFKHKLIKNNANEDIWITETPVILLRPYLVVAPPTGNSFGGAVNITVEGWGPILGVNLEKKYTSKYTLLHMTEKRTGEILVVVRSEGGLWTATFQSTVRLINHLDIDLEISYKVVEKMTIHRVGPAQTFYFPLGTDIPSGFKIRNTDKYEWGANLPLCYPEVDLLGVDSRTLDSQLVYCLPLVRRDDWDTFLYKDESSFVFCADFNLENSEALRWDLRAPLTVVNMLPLQCRCSFTHPDTLKKTLTGAIEPGAAHQLSVPVATINYMFFLKIPRYGSGEHPVRSGKTLNKRLVLHSNNNPPLEVLLLWESEGMSLRATVYVEFWIVNKCGLSLSLKQVGVGSHVYTAPPSNTPLLFSFSNLRIFARRKLQVKVFGAESKGAWSESFAVDHIGAPTLVESTGISYLRKAGSQVGEDAGINEEDVRRVHEIAVTVVFGPVKLTKIVTLKPHLVLYNCSSTILCFAGLRSLKHDVHEVAVGGFCPFYWCSKNSRLLNAFQDRRLCVRAVLKSYIFANEECANQHSPPDTCTRWSKPFACDTPGSYLVKLDASDAGPLDSSVRFRVLRCEVRLEGATLIASFRENQHPEAVRVENFLDHAVVFKESSKGSIKHLLLPGRALPYTYDNPCGIHEIKWKVVGKEKALTKSHWVTISMEEIQRTFQTVKIGDKGKIIYGVSFPEGPTRILLFSERHSVVNRILDRFSSRKTASTKASDSPSEVVFEGHLSLAGAGVSLISLHSKELCYLHVDCVSVDCNVSRLEVDMTVKVQHLQLDNQTDTLFPVLLTASYQPGAAQDDPLFPFFYAKLVKARLTAGQSIYLEHYPLIKIKVRPMVFQVEENFLTELFRFFSFDDLPDQFMVEEPMDAMGEALIEVSHELVLNTDQKATRTLYYEHLNISSISFLLTFMLSSGEQALSDPGNNFVLILLRSIGGAVCNVSRTPIRLSQVQRAHAVSTRKLTYEAIVRHYRFNIIRELFKAFGSLAWLGNPLATLHEISFGLMSFGRLTFFGAKEGRLGRGLRMGCKALWSYTCSGVFNMIVSLLSTLSGLLCSCTLDPSYKKSRKEKLTIKPSTCFASILLGAQLFAHGLAIALIAIIIKPLEGYKRQGPIGLMKGLCRGLLAFIIRPLLAFLDLTTYLLNALVIWASKSRIMKRARPPRFIDADGIIRPYDLHASSGNYILRTMCNGSFKHEAYVDHISYSKATSQGKKRIVLLTNYHLFFLYNLNSGYFAKHEVLLRRIQEKVVTRKGINLIVKRASKSSTRKVKIKTHDTAVRERLLKMLECVEVPLTAEDEEAPKRQLSEESGSDTFWDEMESLKLRANALHSNEAPLEGQSSPEPDGSQMPLFGNEGFTDVSMSEE